MIIRKEKKEVFVKHCDCTGQEALQRMELFLSFLKKENEN